MNGINTGIFDGSTFVVTDDSGDILPGTPSGVFDREVATCLNGSCSSTGAG